MLRFTFLLKGYHKSWLKVFLTRFYAAAVSYILKAFVTDFLGKVRKNVLTKCTKTYAAKVFFFFCGRNFLLIMTFNAYISIRFCTHNSKK